MRTDAAAVAAGLLDELEHGSKRLAAVAHERIIAVGPAAPAIIRAADVRDADEIIGGSRGVSRARALVGSVAHDVIHRVRCPVTVIPERTVDRCEASAEVVEALA
jgi:nucleotide-binding universal stress UspA family protein